jgi:hypothetical protein
MLSEYLPSDQENEQRRKLLVSLPGEKSLWGRGDAATKKQGEMLREVRGAHPRH